MPSLIETRMNCMSFSVGFGDEILNGLDAAVTCYDREGRLVFWNSAAANFFPKSAHTLKRGTTLAERIAAKEAAGYRPTRISFEKNAPAIDTEEWHMPDGRRLIRRRARISLDQNVFVFLDVTDRFAEERRLGRELEKERERYELVMEATRDGIFDRDFATNQVWLSPRAHEILGYPNGALNGDRAIYAALMHQGDADIYSDHFKKQLSLKEPIIASTGRVRHADGDWRWVEARARIVYGEDGDPIRSVGSLADITDRVVAETALKAGEERYALLIDGTREGVYDLNFAGDQYWASPRLHEMMGVPEGTLNGERFVFFERLHPDDIPAMQSRIASFHANREPYSNHLFRARHGDGSWRWLRSRGRVTYGSDGEAIRSVGSVGDVTEEVEAREQLRQAKEELEAKVAERTAHLEREIADRRLAEEAVRRSEKRLEDAINALEDSFSLYDRDDKLVLCNKAFRERAANLSVRDPIGQTYEQLLERLWDDHRIPTTGKTREEWIAERIKQQRSADGSSYEVNRRDGTFRTRAFRTGMGETARLTTDITELRRAEERIRSLFEIMPVGITVQDANGYIVESNEAWRQIYRIETVHCLEQLSFDERLQKIGDRFILDHPDGRPFSAEERNLWLSDRLEAMRTRIPAPAELRAQGGRITRITSVRTADGQLVQAHQDITELRNAERRLATAVNAISDSFALFDAKHRLVLCNGAYRREIDAVVNRIGYGMTFRDICGICWDAGLIVATESKDAWLDKRMRQQKEAHGLPFEVVRGDKSLRVTEYRTDDGEFVRVGSDITDLRHAEGEQRRLASEILRLSEAEVARRNFLLQAVIDTIPDGLVIIQEGQGAVFWNLGFLRIAGLSMTVDSNVAGPLRNQDLRQLLTFLFLDPDALDDLLGGRITHLEHARANGTSVEIRVLESGDGSRLLWIVDTTTRREEETERLLLKERILQAQKSEAIGAIAGTIAHDFNNLLTITLGFAALGQAQLDVLESLPKQLGAADPAIARAASYIANTSGSLKKSLGNIVNAADRGKVIVDNLMHYARGRPAALASADLSKTIGTASALIATSLPSSIGFSVNPVGRALPVRHDPVKIEQVLLNLCINSSHALDGRAGKIRIDISLIETDGGRASVLTAHQAVAVSTAGHGTVDAQGWANRWRNVLPRGRYVRIDVEDDGNGMTPDVLERIFDPFFTTKSKGKGTGLGIPSVDQIVGEHGGAIHVRTKAGAGTVFSVLLPLTEEGSGLQPKRDKATVERADAARDQVEIAVAAPAEATPESARSKVLVVDDEQHLTELAELALIRADYEVDVFNDPLAALARFKEDPTRYAFVMTDQTMPGMTGMQLAAKIVEARPDLPVLLCTGFSAQAIDEKQLPKGVIGVLRKPFAPKDLLRIVAEGSKRRASSKQG
jgi:PAS domain S-box-containing protein